MKELVQLHGFTKLFNERYNIFNVLYLINRLKKYYNSNLQAIFCKFRIYVKSIRLKIVIDCSIVNMQYI
jgi:hypothetical protein